ncbi:unnamed protein product [Gordionus sp. m RMFG-2023]|uniref:E3 ubiquitin-protein ligase RNF113A-like n=1 Tax=Gordionus sp. m RMFG-2023 TaxID=3053472 RepID=UPI0030DE5C58
MLETDQEINSTIKPNCLFFKKNKSINTRKRQKSISGSSSSDGETQIFKSKKIASFNPLKQSTQSGKSGPKNYESSDDEHNSEKEDLITVSFKSTKSEKREGPQDMGATLEYQVDTDLTVDAQAIYQKSLDINKEMKGKKDDKIYRGMNNYVQFIEKKDTVLGNAASNLVRKGPMRAPTFIRSTTRWDYQPDLCKDYQETGYCGFGDSCKFGHDRTDYKFGWQLEQEWNEGRYGQEDIESRKYEILAEILTNDNDDDKRETDDNDDLPFKCAICRQSFESPIVTKCRHYFCESCALKRFRTNARCFVCGAQTFGIFAPANDITAKLAKKSTKKNGSSSLDDSSEEEGETNKHEISGK